MQARNRRRIFIFDANAACVDFNPLGFESVVEWIVVEWVVVEQSGLYELRFALVIGWALDFRCIFFQNSENQSKTAELGLVRAGLLGEYLY